MTENNNNSGVVVFLIFILIWAFFVHKDTYQGKTAEEWYQEYDDEVSHSEDLKNALEEANSHIEDAKSNSFGTFYEMREALESLETVDEPN